MVEGGIVDDLWVFGYDLWISFLTELLFEWSNDFERLAAALVEGSNPIELNSDEFGNCCNVFNMAHFIDDFRRGVVEVIESFVGGALESNNENFLNISSTLSTISACHQWKFNS